MQMVGRDSGDLGLPMTPLESDQLEQLRETLFAFGIQETVAVS